MKTVTIRLTDEWHKKLKVKLAQDEMTIQDYFTRLMVMDINIIKENEK